MCAITHTHTHTHTHTPNQTNYSTIGRTLRPNGEEKKENQLVGSQLTLKSTTKRRKRTESEELGSYHQQQSDRHKSNAKAYVYKRRLCVRVSPYRTGTHGQSRGPWLDSALPNDRTTNLVCLGVASNNSFSIVGTVQLKETENVRKKNDRDGRERRGRRSCDSVAHSYTIRLRAAAEREKDAQVSHTLHMERHTLTYIHTHTHMHARTQTYQSTNTRLC